MTAADFAALLDGADRGAYWTARCPAHTDTDPSLKIQQGDSGVLIHCWAGCRKDDILEAMGLEWGDLFDKPLNPEDKVWHGVKRTLDKEREARKVDEWQQTSGYLDE